MTWSLIASTLGYSFASALLPVIPAELWVVGLVTRLDGTGQILLAITVATLGQMAGKMLIYLVARGTLDLPWIRRRAKPAGKWSVRMARAQAWTEQRPWGPSALCFVSGVVGFPPFALVTVLLAVMKMDWRLYLITGFAGRWLRFGLAALAPGVFTWLF